MALLTILYSLLTHPELPDPRRSHALAARARPPDGSAPTTDHIRRALSRAQER